MIQAYAKNKMKNRIIDLDKNKNPHRIPETIGQKIIEKTEYDKDGKQTTTRTIKRVNLTKSVNETAKLIKEKTAEEKMAEIQKLFTK